MFQVIGTVSVALITLIGGIVTSLWDKKSPLLRRVEFHASLTTSLPKESEAYKNMLSLLDTETAALKTAEVKRINTFFDGYAFFALVFVVLVGSGSMYGLWSWAISVNNGWAIVLYVATVLVALTTLALGISGSSLLLKPKDKKQPEAVGSV